MRTELMMLSNHLILCCTSLFLPSVFPSIRIFFHESAFRIRCPECWSFRFSISPSSEYSGIQASFLLGLTGLISLLSKGLSRVFFNTTVQKHEFFSSQPSLWSNSRINTWLWGAGIALTLWTFVSKVMSLLYNILSGFVIAFLPRSKRLLTSWLQSLSAVIVEHKKIKSVTASIFTLLFAVTWWDQMPWS